ncbi:GGDEF domain-containing protein [Shewanella avicenniae]|uniref:diguanylate cyclase n=1 Tax=Shewanella avicenniae TaxID=2814294 RepID=A0ABX7QSQ7_9GAMM|nr:sensor domain-containing diguanylate cyclase [Shewanella avicenniae]QSX34488.1 GGDEF domain-containing protein [Shewanella avicenniae]
MDNTTLLIQLIFVTGLNGLLTFVFISKQLNHYVSLYWRISAILLFCSTCFFAWLEHYLSAFVIVFSHYLFFLSIMFQLSAAVYFEISRKLFTKIELVLLSAVFIAGFGWFSYVDEDFKSRIVVIWTMLALLGTYAIYFVFVKHRQPTTKAVGIWILFGLTVCLHLVGALLTLNDATAVSLYKSGLLNTIALVYLGMYIITFFVGMQHATIRAQTFQLQQEKDRTAHLFEFLHATAQDLEFSSLYASIENILQSSFNVGTGAIFIRDEAVSGIFNMSYCFDELGLPIEKFKSVSNNMGLAGAAIAQGRAIKVSVDQYHQYVDPAIVQQFKAKGVTHLVSIPLIVGEQALGAVTIIYSAHRPINQLFDIEFFSYLGEQIALVINNAVLYKKVTYLATTDPLTGLFNRRRFKELVKLEQNRMKRQQRCFTIALLDIDHFKSINDSFGHDSGDKVLQAVAAMLKQTCREADSICRWGGEEFVVLLVETGLSEANVVAERIRQECSALQVSGLAQRTVTVSIGLAELRPSDLSVEDLINRADKALYQAKARGRNCVVSDLAG